MSYKNIKKDFPVLFSIMHLRVCSPAQQCMPFPYKPQLSTGRGFLFVCLDFTEIDKSNLKFI